MIILEVIPLRLVYDVRSSCSIHDDHIGISLSEETRAVLLAHIILLGLL